MTDLELTGTPIKANDDGSLTLRFRDPATNEMRHATIPAEQVTLLIQRFQSAAIAAATTGTMWAQLPELHLVDANLGHQAEATELMVSIDQIGWTVLRCPDALLRHLRDLIDRVLTYRSNPTGSGKEKAN